MREGTGSWGEMVLTFVDVGGVLKTEFAIWNFYANTL